MSSLFSASLSRRSVVPVLGALLGTGVAASTFASTGDTNVARQQMERNFYVSKVASLKSKSTMLLTAPGGAPRERQMETISKLQPNGVDSNLVVRFLRPSEIRDTAFLQLEHHDGDDDLWMYLPALKKSRRLVSSNKKDSFLGSDFSYGDLLPPQVNLYDHKLLRNEAIDGDDCYVIESTPKADKTRDDTGYSKKITWLRKSNALEAKVEYYDRQGQLLKTQHARRPQAVSLDKDRWIAAEREMVNHQTGHRTLLRFDRLEPGIAVSDERFSLRTLEAR